MPSISLALLTRRLPTNAFGVDHHLDPGAAQVVGDADRELRRDQRPLYPEPLAGAPGQLDVDLVARDAAAQALVGAELYGSRTRSPSR